VFRPGAPLPGAHVLQLLSRRRAIWSFRAQLPAHQGGVWASRYITILAPRSLIQLANHFKGTQVMARPEPAVAAGGGELPDLKDINGQESGKRTLEIAAAGGHNLLTL
jgi:predicted ATPase with chaperone activity